MAVFSSHTPTLDASTDRSCCWDYCTVNLSTLRSACDPLSLYLQERCQGKIISATIRNPSSVSWQNARRQRCLSLKVLTEQHESIYDMFIRPTAKREWANHTKPFKNVSSINE